MKVLLSQFLQPLRDDLRQPIRMTSCYRSVKLNDAIGGSKTSQHSKGEAADFENNPLKNPNILIFPFYKSILALAVKCAPTVLPATIEGNTVGKPV